MHVTEVTNVVEPGAVTGQEGFVAGGSLPSMGEPVGGAAPAWDGERWVALGPDGAPSQWWDGVRWHPLSVQEVAHVPDPPPGRGAVFGRVAWRSVVLAV
jgi:hypothetical protein